MSIFAPILKPIVEPILQSLYGNSETGSLVFHALTPDDTTYEMLGVKVGTGDLTATHTAEMYALDEVDGIYRMFSANQPIWSGGRVVTDMFGSNNDFLNTTYDWSGEPGVIVDSDTVDLSGSVYGTVNHKDIQTYAGRTYRCTARIRAGQPSDIGKTVFLLPWVSVRSPNSGPEITLTADYITYSTVFTSVNKLWNSDFSVIGHNNQVNRADLVDVEWAKLEDITGQVNQNPGEYFITPARSSANPILYTRVFANGNGNTVISNVVTEGIGTPLPEVPYLQYYPAAQNDQKYSRDFNGAGWANPGVSVSVTQDQVGIDGVSNTAWSVTDSDAAQSAYWEYAALAIPADTNPVTYIFRIKKDTDTVHAGVWGRLKTGGTDTRGLIHINRLTGAHAVSGAAGGGYDAIEVVNDGDWWKVLAQITNTSNSQSEIRLYGAVSTALGTVDATLTGTSVFDNVEVHLNKTIAEVRGLGPIFTTTAAVATDKTTYIFDGANDADNDSTWFVEIEPSVPNTELAANGAVIYRPSPTNEILLVMDDFGGRIYWKSPTALQAPASPWNANDHLKTGAVMSSENRGIACLNGGYGAETTSPGVTSGADLNLFWALQFPHTHRIQNLRRYDITSFDEGTALIDGLMS